jgi:hypothetical protein
MSWRSSRPARALLLVLSVVAAVVTACGAPTYESVKLERRTIGDEYSVQPPIVWNRVTHGKGELWTVNGPLLDAVYLFGGLAEGDRLFEVTGEAKKAMPTFRKAMSEQEIMEFVVDSLVALGYASVEPTGLRPSPFGRLTGFRFELAFVSETGLEQSGLAQGAIEAGKLHLILYLGARQHYFPTYRDEVERLIESVQA